MVQPLAYLDRITCLAEPRSSRGLGHPGPPKRWVLVIAFALVPAAPTVAFAQSANPPNKTGTPSSDSSSEPTPATPNAGAPNAAPKESSANPGSTPSGELPNLPVEAQAEDITFTKEDPKKKYYFVGLRYRGTIIPQFIMNMFVNEGATVYSNTFGAEFEIRSGGQSMIPWIQYTDYNTGDMLFLQKGQADAPNNRTVVNSSLKGLYLGLDELWSVNINDHLDFEYGFGVGVGGIWGDLMNNWVFLDPNGPYVGADGRHYSKCTMVTAAAGCAPSSHTDPSPAKVGGYVEPNWFSGGGVPVVFLHVAIPQFSLRYKPIKQLETRISTGFSLTGFWFGLSIDYGLEHQETPEHTTARRWPHPGEML
jgi:hypothetical protein